MTFSQLLSPRLICVPVNEGNKMRTAAPFPALPPPPRPPGSGLWAQRRACRSRPGPRSPAPASRGARAQGRAGQTHPRRKAGAQDPAHWERSTHGRSPRPRRPRCCPSSPRPAGGRTGGWWVVDGWVDGRMAGQMSRQVGIRTGPAAKVPVRTCLPTPTSPLPEGERPLAEHPLCATPQD